MGTNYYWFREPPTHKWYEGEDITEGPMLGIAAIRDGNRELGLHIGKSSFGCAFTMRSYPQEKITTPGAWVDLLLQDGVVVTGQGSMVPIKVMLECFFFRKPAQTEKTLRRYPGEETVEWGPTIDMTTDVIS